MRALNAVTHREIIQLKFECCMLFCRYIDHESYPDYGLCSDLFRLEDRSFPMMLIGHEIILLN